MIQARNNAINFDDVDHMVTNFVKFESYAKCTDPRNISSRDFTHLTIMGPHVTKLDSALGGASFSIKGLNFPKRDEKMSVLGLYSQFLEIDFERFDMTISSIIIRLLEMLFLLLPFKDCDLPETQLFRRIVSMLVFISGKSYNGIKYRIIGTRASGDTHTSSSNTVINRFLVHVIFRIAGIEDYVTFNEGDDGVIGFRGDRAKVEHAISMLYALGFKCKYSFTDNLEDVTFCGRKMTFLKSTFISYCDVLRTVNKLHITCNQGNLMLLLLAKAMSYYSNDKHTPIVGSWAYYLIKMLYPKVYGKNRLIKHLNNIHPYYRKQFLEFDITKCELAVMTDLRAVVAHTSGISIAEQIRLEDQFLNWYQLGIICDIDPIVLEKETIDNHILGYPVPLVTDEGQCGLVY